MGSSRTSTFSVAVAQVRVDSGAVDQNLATVVAHIEQAGRGGHDLVVFGECSLTGYMFDTAEQTRAAAIDPDDPRLGAVVAACQRAGILAVVGLLELAGEHVHNTALLIGGQGVLGRYRKEHLPHFGADRFVTPGAGDQPRVIATDTARIGLMICFDLRFPESARVLALEGADVIAMPTAWPESATMLAEHFTRVRAVENLVYLAVADLGGEENGTPYLGGSQIVAPTGDVLVRADRAEGVFGAVASLETARNKHLVVVPGSYELAVFDERKPRLYSAITNDSSPGISQA